MNTGRLSSSVVFGEPGERSAATRICFVSSRYSIPSAGAAFPTKTVPQPHPTAALTISTTNVQEPRERRVAGLAGSHTSLDLWRSFFFFG